MLRVIVVERRASWRPQNVDPLRQTVPSLREGWGFDMGVTLKDVASRAGVSRAAVSRTFTEGASVSARMRARVERAATELGYRPNMLARGLMTRRTRMVGLISNNFHNPVFLQIFDLFTRGLQEAGLRPLLVNLSDEIDPVQSLQMLQQYAVDGVVIASSHLPDGFAAAFRAAGMPVVHAFGRAGMQPDVHVAGIDNVAAGRMAAEVLVARGYDSLGFIGGPESASTTQDRLAGFRIGAGAIPVQIRYAGAYSFAAGRSAMMAELPASAAAYFCADDVLSIGAMSAVRDAGLTVPGDVGIIGLNDMEMAAWARIDLTTIHQPFAAIVAASIAMIEAQFDNPAAAPIAQLFPCHLVERGTLRAV
jgi:DNA-binding LacI/PurR family transcriptional regulator